MNKKIPVLLVLILAASSLLMVKPASSASARPLENTWTEKEPMHEARFDLAAAEVDGKIYAIGGHAQEIGIVGTNEEYDPTTDTWIYRKPMPTPRLLLATAVYQNKIYCIGGKTGEKENVGDILTMANEVYDPATDTWETKTPMPTARLWASANVVDGKIYVLGGYPNTTLCEVYDPATDTWMTKAPLSTELFGPSAVYDGKIYVIWGRTLIYDPTTSSMSLGATQPESYSSGSVINTIGVTAGMMAPRRMYVFGGGFNQVFTPETDSWAFGATFPTPRGGFAVAVADDLLYIVGGVSTYDPTPTIPKSPDEIQDTVTTYHATVEAYTPFGYGTIPPKVTVVSPENKNYTSNEISLNFTLNRPAEWTGYSLDGQNNMTVPGNLTLTKVPNGMHNITVYANDTYSNMGASETVCFVVAVPEPFPIVPLFIASVAVVLVVAGSLVYLKKRGNSKTHKDFI